MKGIIVVLGSPNSDRGELSEIAINRLERALSYFMANKDFKILCTGGFGEHFNKTSFPHAKYAADYLKKKGVQAEDILEYVLSSNTFEDVLKTIPLVEKYQPENLVVITSDFHIERAGILFKRHLQGRRIILIEATSTMAEESMQKLREHERNAVRRLSES